MADPMPTTLTGAVSVDTQRLEGIFQAVIGRLDQQGAQIQALADALVLCGSGEEVATIGQRLDSLESQMATRASMAVEERNSSDIALLKQELAAKADGALMAETCAELVAATNELEALQQRCTELQINKVDVVLGNKLQASDELMNEALAAMQTMLTCKADRADFSSLYAATERARNFEKFQQLADAKLLELERALTHCTELTTARATGQEMERVCVRVAALERTCIDQGDRLQPGEAPHIRTTLANSATKDEVRNVQQQNAAFAQKVDDLLERLWSVQREVAQSAPRSSVEHLIEVVGLKADKNELNSVASKRWCEDLASMLRGELRASAEDLHHLQGNTSSELDRYKAETVDLRWQVQELDKKSQLMTRFINAF